MKAVAVLALAALLCSASAKIYMKETFDDESWSERWTSSTAKGASAGKLKLTAGKWYGDKVRDKGVQTSEDYRFYHYTAPLDETFENKGKDLVFQFTVKHEQKLDCGGGYLKLLPTSADVNPESFDGDTPYAIMFGPDICGPSNRKVHVILTHGGKNHLITKDIRPETDQLTHQYTLIIHPDQTYEVEVDERNVAKGSLEEDWDILPPKEINDPDASKPNDWVDDAEIDDPTDTKPADWDDEPEFVPDPDATKPEDWDEELDGEWEAPQVPNPAYKGEWHPNRIPNPDYKGPWVHPKIPNPEYEANDAIYDFGGLSHVAMDLWQVKSGTIFDNIIVTDSVDEARAFADETFKASKDDERTMFNKSQEDQRKKDEEERKKREEERKAAEADEDELEDEDEEEEEEDDEEEEEDDEPADVDEGKDEL